jgi:hypothetical protein
MSDDDIKPFRPEELPDQIKAFFSAIYSLECEVEALKAKHITPVSDEIKAKRRMLKAGCDMNAKDIKLAYDLWKRLEQTTKMEDEAEGQRVQADIRRIFAALQKGEMVDFLSVLGADDALKPLADDLIANEHDDIDGDGEFDGGDGDDDFEDVSGPKPLNLTEAGGDLSGEAMAEEDEPPAAEWAVVEDDGNTEVLDGAGFVFISGREAGEQGALADTNPYGDDQAEQAELWERGRIIGFRQFDADRTQAEAAEVAEDMESAGEERDAGAYAEVIGPQDGDSDDDGQDDDLEVPAFLRRDGGAEIIQHPSAVA